MFTLLLLLLILCGIFIMVIVLLQAGKGGGLAAVGGGMGTESFIGGRQATSLLVRSTWVAGGAFMGLALVLSVLTSRQHSPEPLLRGEFQEAPRPLLPGPGTPPGETPGEPGIPQGGQLPGVPDGS